MLSRKGMSQRKIGKKLGISRNTVKKYLEKPEFPESRWGIRKRKSLLDPYRDNIEVWLKEDPDYTAIRIYDRLSAMGFAGSYEIVKRKVSAIKAERQKIAYIRFETEPGYKLRSMAMRQGRYTDEFYFTFHPKLGRQKVMSLFLI